LQPVYVSKSPTTIPTSSGVGLTSSGSTLLTTTTLISSALDTARRIIVSASTEANISSLLVTITGTNQTGATIKETVRGSTGAAGTSVTTLNDFLTITSVSFSSTPEPPILLGTSSMSGTSWNIVNWHVTPINLSAFVTLNTSQAQASWEYTLDDPTRSFAQNPVFTQNGYVAAPAPIVSSMISAVIGTCGLALGSCGTYGFISNPIAAWRITLASTGTAYTALGTVIQSGIG
jgi:hypothetical protein